jgi:hypothetical protein
MSEDSDRPQTVWPGPAPQESQEASVPERRNAQRFPFTAAAEVTDLRSKTRVTGRSADLGLGGCYIDTMSPFAVGSAVQIRLERDLRELEATGVVTYALVSMGMGLSFTDIKPEHRAVLKTWIAELSGEKATNPEFTSTSPEQGMMAAMENNRQVLNELITLMVRKKIIRENEGAALLRQMFR